MGPSTDVAALSARLDTLSKELEMLREDYSYVATRYNQLRGEIEDLKDLTEAERRAHRTVDLRAYTYPGLFGLPPYQPLDVVAPTPGGRGTQLCVGELSPAVFELYRPSEDGERIDCTRFIEPVHDASGEL